MLCEMFAFLLYYVQMYACGIPRNHSFKMHRNATRGNVRGTIIGRVHSANSLITTREHINFDIELAPSKHTHIPTPTTCGLSMKWLWQIGSASCALSGSNATNICGNRNYKDKQTA